MPRSTGGGDRPFAGRLPPAFERRVLALAAGTRHRYEPGEWRDTLVLIESGEIELQCAGQPSRRFHRGHLLWLTGLGVSAIHNHGPEAAVLVAVRRRPQ